MTRRARVGGAGCAAVAVLLMITAAAQTPQPSPPSRPSGASGQPEQPGPDAQPAQGQPQDEQQQPPVFRTGINFVRVDVIVSDRQGNAMADLRQSDFEVLEDGKPQTIEAFRLIKVDGTAPIETQRAIRTRADEESAAANEDSRIFAFFLDDYHVRLGSSMASRRPLVEFVRTLGPNDLVTVMYPLTPLDAVTLTRDHQAVIRTIERFEGRKFNYQPRNALEERYALYPAEIVERVRRQVSLSALEGLAIKMGALREGRKAVILVSEGFTALLPPQMRDPIAAMPGLGNRNRRNPMAGQDSSLEDRAAFMGQMDVQQELREVFAAANRHNTAIYAVDPRGLATSEFDIDENVGVLRSNESLRQTQDTLRVLAEETDGRAIVNRNDLAKAMKQIVADSSLYYLLGYNSTQAPQDGKFHEIKVRVKRAGAQIRSRKGYWALTATETVRAVAPKAGPPPAVNRALAAIADPSHQRYIRTWFGNSRGENGKTRVTFVWESVPPQPGVRRAVARHVSLIAASPEGALYFNGRVPGDDVAAGNGSSDVGNGGATTEAARPGAAVTFEAPPGRLRLRMSVMGDNGALDADDREIVVPDLTLPEVVLGTPRVHVARNVREFQVISKDPTVLPTASRDFRRTDRLLVRTEALGPGGSPVTVTSRLLNRQGQRMSDLPVTPPAAGGNASLVDLPLAGLPPGEYLLEIAAAAAGHQPATELIAFRVGS